MTASITIAENATGPTFTFTIKTGNPKAPRNLTNSTVSLFLYNEAMQELSSRQCTIDADPTTGKVSWKPELVDTDTVEANRKAWLKEVTQAGDVLWHPTPGHIAVRISGNQSG